MICWSGSTLHSLRTFVALGRVLQSKRSAINHAFVLASLRAQGVGCSPSFPPDACRSGQCFASCAHGTPGTLLGNYRETPKASVHACVPAIRVRDSTSIKHPKFLGLTVAFTSSGGAYHPSEAFLDSPRRPTHLFDVRPPLAEVPVAHNALGA